MPFRLRPWPHRDTRQLWPASEQWWAAPGQGPRYFSPFPPGLYHYIKVWYKGAVRVSIPQSHLELTVKSEVYDSWPKLTLTSNMDVVIVTIRFFKFHDKQEV